ncbi:MAG: hypothetical protein V1685_04730 [Parcubacteria group bacterium]
MNNEVEKNSRPESTVDQPEVFQRQVETDQLPPDIARESAIPTVELSDDEKVEISGVREQTRASFGALYELLPHSGKLEEEQVVSAMKTVESLANLTPVPRCEVVAAITRLELNQKSKEEFVGTLMKLQMLDLWIHMQGLNRAGDRRLKETRGRIAA